MIFDRMLEIIKRKSAIPENGESFAEISEAYDQAIDILEKSRWIPVSYRARTEEEKKRSEPEIDFVWTCPLPNDHEEVLITTRSWGVQATMFRCSDCCYFDDWDEDDIVAWMPYPQGYKEETS